MGEGGEVLSNLLRRRPHPPLIHLPRPLPHRARKPPQPLTQRAHRIPLEIIHPRHPLLLLPLSLHPRRRAPKPSVLPALTRRQPLRPRLIRIAHPREIRFVGFLPARPSRGTLFFPPPLDLFPFRHPRELPPLDLARQPLFPLLAHFPAIPLDQHLRRRRHLPHGARVLPLPEGAEGGVAAELHAADLGRFEGVHGCGADEGDVHAEAAVVARAGEADEEAEFGGCPSEEGALGVGVWRGKWGGREKGGGTVGRGRRSRRRGCWRGAFGVRGAEGEGWSEFRCMDWGVGGSRTLLLVSGSTSHIVGAVGVNPRSSRTCNYGQVILIRLRWK